MQPQGSFPSRSSVRAELSGARPPVAEVERRGVLGVVAVGWINRDPDAGRHEELVAMDGLYADLYRKQLLEEELAKAVGKELVGLSSTQEGRTMLERLGITHFEQATNETYKPVQQYLKVFSETVRHIEY